VVGRGGDHLADRVLVVHPSRGVRRRAEDDRGGVRGHGVSDPLGGQRIPLVGGHRYLHGFRVGEVRLRRVVRPPRRGNQELLAGSDRRQHGQVERLHPAVGDDDLVGVDVDVEVGGHPPGDDPPEFGQPRVRRVMRVPRPRRVGGRLDDVCGRVEVRFPDFEPNQVAVGRLGHVVHHADRRAVDAAHPLGWTGHTSRSESGPNNVRVGGGARRFRRGRCGSDAVQEGPTWRSDRSDGPRGVGSAEAL
jgi:hypothetical protein